jgi:hypothetical protein
MTKKRKNCRVTQTCKTIHQESLWNPLLAGSAAFALGESLGFTDPVFSAIKVYISSVMANHAFQHNPIQPIVFVPGVDTIGLIEEIHQKHPENPLPLINEFQNDEFLRAITTGVSAGLLATGDENAYNLAALAAFCGWSSDFMVRKINEWTRNVETDDGFIDLIKQLWRDPWATILKLLSGEWTAPAFVALFMLIGTKTIVPTAQVVTVIAMIILSVINDTVSVIGDLVALI